MAYKISIIDETICKIEFSEPFPPDPENIDPATYCNDPLRTLLGVRRLENRLPAHDEILHHVELYKLNVYSLLILANAVRVDAVGGAPQDMVDHSLPSNWWRVANTVTSFLEWFQMEVVSYSLENDGELYVHLSPQAGSSRGAEKSRKGMRGHTDAVMFPTNLPERHDPIYPPAPDTVVLVGIRNERRVSTKIAPLSAIFSKLSSNDVEVLTQPAFVFFPQSSFSLPETTRFEKQQILDRTAETGWRIRFSNSAIQPMDANDVESATALSHLGSAVAASFRDVVVDPGDIVLVNNNTAIHGRSEVGAPEFEERKRWLLRTYTQNTKEEKYCVDERGSHILCVLTERRRDDQ